MGNSILCCLLWMCLNTALVNAADQQHLLRHHERGDDHHHDIPREVVLLLVSSEDCLDFAHAVLVGTTIPKC